MSGFICINKPAGISSFDVVRRLKKFAATPKIGHAGTLDPFASGLMICAIGRQYTKQIDRIQGLDKYYRFGLHFGSQTDTLDPTGTVICDSIHLPSLAEKCQDPQFQESFKRQLVALLDDFRGDISQLPPSFSAKKINGKRAYALARKGQFVELQPVTIHIGLIELEDLHFDPYPNATIRIRCSKGTYVRSLVRDIGDAMGYPSMTTWLIREQIGHWHMQNAADFDSLDEAVIQKERFFDCDSPN